MIKLLISDVDGTLLPYGAKALDTKAHNAIATAIKKGIKVAIASGRSYENLRELFCDFANDIYFVAHDGAVTIKNGATLFRQPLKQDTLASIVKMYGGSQCIALYSTEKCYIIGTPSPLVQSKSIIPVRNLFEVKEQIFKVGIYTQNADVMQPIMNTRLCSKGDGYIELVSAFAEKGTAVSDLQMRLFLNKFDTAAVGNYHNDSKMLKNAKYSAAMASAPDEVKKAALYQVENAAEFIMDIINKQ